MRNPYHLNDDGKIVLQTDYFTRLMAEDLENRHLYLEVPIYEKYQFEMICTDILYPSDIEHYIRSYNRMDDLAEAEAKAKGEEFVRKPIWIYLCSYGGSIYSGQRLIGAIRTSRTKVIVVNNGICASMAALILISGHERLGMPGSTVLIHEGSFELSDSTSKAIDSAKFQEEFEEFEVKPLILSRTKITEVEYLKNYRKEWYMRTEDALKYGIIDKIVESISETY